MYFLRLNKTGSSAMVAALRPVELSGHYRLMLRQPRTLADIPDGEQFFFAVRDPVSRFVSGFFSRKRQGGEGHPRPWRSEEERVYREFSTPNELASALSAPNPEERARAEAAMRTIHHFRSYWSRFGDEEYFRGRTQDLLMVLFQERLEEDFRILTRLLGVRSSLPSERSAAHRAPEGEDRNLSEVAVANLHRWYERDYEFVELCRTLRPDLYPS